MEAITDGQLEALRNLSVRGSGELTPFLNIADAQRLTELGLASHSRQGWEITPEGSAYLAQVDRGGADHFI